MRKIFPFVNHPVRFICPLRGGNCFHLWVFDPWSPLPWFPPPKKARWHSEKTWPEFRQKWLTTLPLIKKKKSDFFFSNPVFHAGIHARHFCLDGGITSSRAAAAVVLIVSAAAAVTAAAGWGKGRYGRRPKPQKPMWPDLDTRYRERGRTDGFIKWKNYIKSANFFFWILSGTMDNSVKMV